MAINCRTYGRALLTAFALFVAAPAAFAAPPAVAPDVEREVIAPEGVIFKPAPTDEEGAIDRLAAYTMALSKRDFESAYAMLRLSFQASNPRLEWEMNLRKRTMLWADGMIRILRLSWYLDPPGQPAGLYAAFDFRGDRPPDKTMDCGYVVVHRATSADSWTVVRTDTSEVPGALIEDGVPKADVLRQLPCYLGKGIATNF